MRVLLVEDDRLIGSGVEDGLAEAGMRPLRGQKSLPYGDQLY